MKKEMQSKKMGRPVGSTKTNPMTAKILVQVTPDKLAEYKEAAAASGSNFSQWVRNSLDNQAELQIDLLK